MPEQSRFRSASLDIHSDHVSKRRLLDLVSATQRSSRKRTLEEYVADTQDAHGRDQQMDAVTFGYNQWTERPTRHRSASSANDYSAFELHRALGTADPSPRRSSTILPARPSAYEHAIPPLPEACPGGSSNFDFSFDDSIFDWLYTEPFQSHSSTESGQRTE